MLFLRSFIVLFYLPYSGWLIIGRFYYNIQLFPLEDKKNFLIFLNIMVVNHLDVFVSCGFSYKNTAFTLYFRNNGLGLRERERERERASE
jgi:hypothetical protein